VVVATHADGDVEALERVLSTDAGYVSLVASQRRAAAIVERLQQRGKETFEQNPERYVADRA
jgi:xanthine/CO dehydrogenase XdhC/CoxF family maturation factor